MTATRRWWQFRLRTLCVVLAVALAGVGLYWRAVVEQRAIVDELASKGRTWIDRTLIRTDRENMFGLRLEPSADGPWGLDDHWFHRVVEVRLKFPQVSNREAALASRLHSLDFLALSDGGPEASGYPTDEAWEPKTTKGCNSTLDDQGARTLRGLRRLRHLDVRGAQITDIGLAYLTELQDLRELILSRTRISDRAGTLLARLPRLRRVVLCDTQIGDATLRALADYAELKVVDVRGTQVTRTALNEFRSRRPDVELAIPWHVIHEYIEMWRRHDEDVQRRLAERNRQSPAATGP